MVTIPVRIKFLNFHSLNSSLKAVNINILSNRNFCSSLPKLSNNSLNIQSTLILLKNRHGLYQNYGRIHITGNRILFNCLPTIVETFNHSQRFYSINSPKSNDTEDSKATEQQKRRKRSLPQLMNFPEIVWPSVLKSIRNWILVTFIIRPYFDNEFNLPDFVAGTKQALQVVSTKLSEGDLSQLCGLVTSEAIAEIKNVISKMSIAERMELRVKKEDIYLSFPYQVGVIFDETSEKPQKRWVEITMVFHVLRGLKDIQDRGQQPPLNMGVLPEYRDKISICNYRFIKEFTQGNESDWTVNVINHFKPSDFLTEE